MVLGCQGDIDCDQGWGVTSPKSMLSTSIIGFPALDERLQAFLDIV
jgi:hypothetical protein